MVLMSLVLQGLTMPALARRLGLVDTEGAAARSRQRAALLDGFVAAHEELDRLQEAGSLPRVEQRHLERTIEEQENVLLEGLDPESEEPAEGDEERLSERMGALVAQRRRITALRTPACSRTTPPRSSRTRSTGGSRCSPTGSSASRRRPATRRPAVRPAPAPRPTRRAS